MYEGGGWVVQEVLGSEHIKSYRHGKEAKLDAEDARESKSSVVLSLEGQNCFHACAEEKGTVEIPTLGGSVLPCLAVPSGARGQKSCSFYAR